MRLLLPAFLALALTAHAQELRDDPAPDGIRPGGTLTDNAVAPPIPREITAMPRPTRAWPEQPPMIPHSIRGYQIDKNYNQCLACHSRSTAEASGAPMVSITHFWDRDGQALAAVSPRRYFCVQCHLPQNDIAPVKTSGFQTIDEVLQRAILERQ